MNIIFTQLRFILFLIKITVYIIIYFWYFCWVVACEGGPSYRYDRAINTCYSVKGVRRSWYAAQLHCQAEKAWLLDLSDHQVASHLMKTFNNYHDPCRWIICSNFKKYPDRPIYMNVTFGICRLLRYCLIIRIKKMYCS